MVDIVRSTTFSVVKVLFN